MNRYRTTQVADLFGVSSTTVRNWAGEFKDYLSPTAQPSGGGRYLFTEDDVRVFALAHLGVQRGMDYESIHRELKNGQRGEIPEYAETAGALVPLAATQQLVRMKDEIERLNQEIEILQTARDKAEGKVDLLRSLLDEREQLIRQLYEENANLKAKG